MSATEKDYRSMSSRMLAICIDNNLPTDYSYVLAYFHFKSKDSNSLDFPETDEYGKKVLEVMLGITHIDLWEFSEEDKLSIEATKLILCEADKLLREKYGKENFMLTGIKQNYRLYHDKDYFEKVKNDYLTLITPSLSNYTLEKSKIVVDNYYIKQDLKKKDDIDELLESIK